MPDNNFYPLDEPYDWAEHAYQLALERLEDAHALEELVNMTQELGE